MARIATITCHKAYNHGATLQEYALARYLQKLGHEVNIINYTPRRGGGFMGRAFFNRPILRTIYKLLKRRREAYRRHRRQAFDICESNWITPMLTPLRYFSHEELVATPPQADVYVAGSDQIWNTSFVNGTDPAFYLDFGDDKVHRISFAASFATENLREGTENFVKQHLKKLDVISVREQSGLKILNSLNFEGNLVCDPTFLLSADEWSKKAAPFNPKRKYLLVYDTYTDDEMKRVAKRIARLHGLKIYSISGEPLHYAHRNFHTSGPDMFISLIKNATCVVSNSFHGTAFSLIFNRPFVVVNRKDGLNVRMRDILERLGLEDRLVNSMTDASLLSLQSPLQKVGEKLSDEIETSKRWIAENL